MAERGGGNMVSSDFAGMEKRTEADSLIILLQPPNFLEIPPPVFNQWKCGNLMQRHAADLAATALWRPVVRFGSVPTLKTNEFQFWKIKADGVLFNLSL